MSSVVVMAPLPQDTGSMEQHPGVPPQDSCQNTPAPAQAETNDQEITIKCGENTSVADNSSGDVEATRGSTQQTPKEVDSTSCQVGEGSLPTPPLTPDTRGLPMAPAAPHASLHTCVPSPEDTAQDLLVHLQGMSLGERGIPTPPGQQLEQENTTLPDSQVYSAGAAPPPGYPAAPLGYVAPWENEAYTQEAVPWVPSPEALSPWALEAPAPAVPGQVVGSIEDFQALVAAGMALPAPGAETQGPMVFWGPDHEGRFIGGPASILPGYYYPQNPADWTEQQPQQGDWYPRNYDNNCYTEEYYPEVSGEDGMALEDVTPSRIRRNSVDSGNAGSDTSFDNASVGFETSPEEYCNTDSYEKTPKVHNADYGYDYYGNQYAYIDNQCYYVPELQQGVLYSSPGWGVIEETPCYLATSQASTIELPYQSYQS